MRRRGANAVEFALLLPVFVAVLAGAMELSWLFYQQSAVRSAVSRGCRAAAMMDPGSFESSMSTMVGAARANVLGQYTASVGPCPSCASNATAVGTVPTRSLRCELTAPYIGLTGLLGQRVAGDLQDSVVIRMEYQRRVR